MISRCMANPQIAAPDNSTRRDRERERARRARILDTDVPFTRMVRERTHPSGGACPYEAPDLVILRARLNESLE